MNKVIMVGRLSTAPKSSFMSNGTDFCRFNIDVDREQLEDGEKETDFFQVTTFGKVAENCGKFLDKGSMVLLDGTIQNNTFTDSKGVKRYLTTIIANKVTFLSKPNKNENEKKTLF